MTTWRTWLGRLRRTAPLRLPRRGSPGDTSTARRGRSPPLLAALEHVFSAELATVTEPRVVVLARGEPGDVSSWLTEIRPGRQVFVVRVGVGPARRHVGLTAATPVDLLVDRSGVEADAGRVADLLRYVRPGGVVLTRLPSAAIEDTELLTALEGDLQATRGCRYARRTGSGRWLLTVGDSDDQPIIRESQVSELLELRPDLGRTILQRPEQEVSARGAVRMNRDDQQFPVRRHWTVPPMALREYYDAESAPGQVVTVSNILLPASFRHIFRQRVKNKWLSPGRMDMFARPAERRIPRGAVPPLPEGPRRLTGSYFHLDIEHRGHFGHVTTDMLGKVWGWHAARSHIPEIKALLHTSARGDVKEWELALLEAAGVPREDVVITPEPVQVERLVTATPMFGNPRYVHPDLVELWEETAERLETTTRREVPERIFVSRRPGRRRECHNTKEVETFFEQRGYTVVFPEEHSLGEQVQLFRRSKAIAGLVGSGMFGIMWATEPKPVTLISSDVYPGRNEFLIAGLIGHELDVVWSPARPPQTDTDQRVRGIDVPFEVDLQRDGAFLHDAAVRGTGTSPP